MKKVILFGGCLAAGKSTFSNIVGDKYNILIINKDNLKEILGDNFFAKNREENKKLSVASFQLIKYILYKEKNVVGFESNFKDYEMEELTKYFSLNDIDVLSFVFDADDEILHQRFLKRLNENRHYVHKSEDFSNLDDFTKMLNGLRNVKYPGKVVNICCNDFSYQKDEKLFKIVEQFLSE